jgi:hypothetical protein
MTVAEVHGVPPVRSTKSTLGRPATRAAAAGYLTIAAMVALVAIGLDPEWGPVATLLLMPVALLAGIYAFRTTNDLVQEWRTQQLGANVKRALATLGPAYRIVTRGAASPDRDSHVAIGPNGIFLVLSSDDGGRVTASDQRLFVNARLPWRNVVEDCRVEALRVADRVQRALGRPLPVHAVLCFTRALVAVGQEIRGVKIVQVPRLARAIASVAAAATLSDADIEAARAALVTSATASPLRPVFRITRRRPATIGERPLSLVGRSSTPHRSR